MVDGLGSLNDASQGNPVFLATSSPAKWDATGLELLKIQSGLSLSTTSMAFATARRVLFSLVGNILPAILLKSDPLLFLESVFRPGSA